MKKLNKLLSIVTTLSLIVLIVEIAAIFEVSLDRNVQEPELNPIGIVQAQTPITKIKDVEIKKENETSEKEYEPEHKLIDLGEYRITFYCGCEICNGPNPGVDAHDTPLRQGVVASNDIPQFTHIFIEMNGELQEYEVRDRMANQYTGKNCIDIYTENHNMANELGVIYKNVYVKE